MTFRIGPMLAVCAALIPLPAMADGSGFPDRPLRYIVPFPAGGPTDAVARPIAQKLSQLAGQPVVVDNRAGAGGGIGAAAAAAAPADGLTLFHGTVSNMAINTSLYRSLPYSPDKDFRPLTLLAAFPSVVVVAADFPATDLRGLLDWARANPGKATFGSGGSGTSQHLAGEMLRQMSGIPLVHVPYRGAAPALTDLMAGQITMMIDNLPSALPLVRSGKLRALAVTTPARIDDLRDVPTVAESGFPGYEVSSWHGAFVPARTPPEIVDRLHALLTQTLASREILDQMRRLGASVQPMTPDAFTRFIADETVRWAAIVKASGAKVD